MLLQDLDRIRQFSLWPVIIIGLGAAMVMEAADRRDRSKEEDSPATWRDL